MYELRSAAVARECLCSRTPPAQAQSRETCFQGLVLPSLDLLSKQPPDTKLPQAVLQNPEAFLSTLVSHWVSAVSEGEICECALFVSNLLQQAIEARNQHYPHVLYQLSPIRIVRL